MSNAAIRDPLSYQLIAPQNSALAERPLTE
jgi:hypothetical protein